MSNSTKSSTPKKSFIAEFKEFINRGSVVDLAVGVAVGGAFTTIVNSLVNDIVMPIVSLIGGGANIADLSIDIPNFLGGDSSAHIAYGNFLQNVLEFLIIALVVFSIIKAMNRVREKADHAKALLDAKTNKAEANKKTKK